MRILLTNDDGVYSPGISALAEAAARFGEVRIVAPDVERSSAGHSITAARPLGYKRTPLKGVEAYRVDGTPADCVALGTYHWEKVDVVLSGINLGSNLWTRQSVRHYDGKVVPGKDPMGRTHYWFTVVPLESAEEGTDRWAIERGYVSMTPLRLDLTDGARLAAAQLSHPVDRISF
jgi:broad specificity polyphosphatase/5'/3'-nucleotidase SurE